MGWNLIFAAVEHVVIEEEKEEVPSSPEYDEANKSCRTGKRGPIIVKCTYQRLMLVIHFNMKLMVAG